MLKVDYINFKQTMNFLLKRTNTFAMTYAIFLNVFIHFSVSDEGGTPLSSAYRDIFR